MGYRILGRPMLFFWFSTLLFLSGCDLSKEDVAHDGEIAIAANFNHGPLVSVQIAAVSHVPVQFINQSHGFDEYEWEFPDGERSSALAVQKSFDRGGEYFVKLHGRGPVNRTDSIMVYVKDRQLTALRFTFPELHPIYIVFNEYRVIFRIVEPTPENNIPKLDQDGRYDANVLFETKPVGGAGIDYANLTLLDLPRPILAYPDPAKNLGYTVSYEPGNGKEEILISNWSDAASVSFKDDLFYETSVLEITQGEITMRLEAFF